MSLALLQALAAFAGLVWTLIQLRRAPGHRGLWLVTACLATAEAVYVLGLDPVAAALNTTIAAGASKVPENVAVMVFHFLVIWFFLNAAGTPASRVRRQALICSLACVALVTARCAIPPADRGTLYSLTMHSVPVAVFYFIPSLYLDYALMVEIGFAGRYARLSGPPLRHGLWIVMASLVAKFVGGPAYQSTATVAYWVGHPAAAGTFALAHAILVTGIVAFPLGIVYPGIIGRLRATRRWWRHRQDYHGLESLWQLMTQAFPEDVLHRVPSGRWRGFLTVQSMHRRYYRRVIECRDGLVRISPYLPPVEAAGSDLITAAVRAQALRAALQARAHQLPPTGQPVAFASPRSPKLDADVAELLALSRAFTQPATPLPVGPGTRPRTRE